MGTILAVYVAIGLIAWLFGVLIEGKLTLNIMLYAVLIVPLWPLIVLEIFGDSVIIKWKD